MGALLLASIGVPMLAAGQDFLHSKQGVTNTYLRGDLNALDYRRRQHFAGTHAYFADWIAFRRSERGRLLRQYSRPGEGFFRFCFAPESTAAAVVFNAGQSEGSRQLLLAVNPTLQHAAIPLGDAARIPWRQLADHEHFFSAAECAAARPVGAVLPVPALGCGLWMAG
jgi:hypothetical protein